jgi:hypothetical protein
MSMVSNLEGKNQRWKHDIEGGYFQAYSSNPRSPSQERTPEYISYQENNLSEFSKILRLIAFYPKFCAISVWLHKT